MTRKKNKRSGYAINYVARDGLGVPPQLGYESLPDPDEAEEIRRGLDAAEQTQREDAASLREPGVVEKLMKKISPRQYVDLLEREAEMELIPETVAKVGLQLTLQLEASANRVLHLEKELEELRAEKQDDVKKQVERLLEPRQKKMDEEEAKRQTAFEGRVDSKVAALIPDKVKVEKQRLQTDSDRRKEQLQKDYDQKKEQLQKEYDQKKELQQKEYDQKKELQQKEYDGKVAAQVQIEEHRLQTEFDKRQATMVKTEKERLQADFDDRVNSRVAALVSEKVEAQVKAEKERLQADFDDRVNSRVAALVSEKVEAQVKAEQKRLQTKFEEDKEQLQAGFQQKENGLDSKVNDAVREKLQTLNAGQEAALKKRVDAQRTYLEAKFKTKVTPLMKLLQEGREQAADYQVRWLQFRNK